MKELVLDGRENKKLKTFTIAIALAGLAWFLWPAGEEQQFSKFRHPSAGAHIEKDEPEAQEPTPQKIQKLKEGGRIPAQRRETPLRSEPFRREMPRKDGAARTKALELLKRKGSKPKKPQRAQVDFANERGEGFELVDDMSAVEKNQENEIRYPGAQAVAGHLLINEPPAPGASMAVVRNVKDGNYAVFTGILRVKFKDFTYERELAAAHNAIIEKSYDYIQTSLLRFETYEETLAALTSLQGHPAVLTVTVELLEYGRQPN